MFERYFITFPSQAVQETSERSVLVKRMTGRRRGRENENGRGNGKERGNERRGESGSGECRGEKMLARTTNKKEVTFTPRCSVGQRVCQWDL